MGKDVAKIIDAIRDQRKLPVLVLSLKEVKKSGPLTIAKLLSGKKFEEIDIVLQTPGGDIDAAYLIAKIIRRHSSKVNVLVPLIAKSAGTLIAISSDNIYLSDMSELGPLDTQFRESKDGQAQYKSALNGFKALSQIQAHNLETVDLAAKLFISRSDLSVKEAIKLANDFVGNTSRHLYEKFDPYKIGEYARYLEIGERYGINVLTQFRGVDFEQAEQSLKELVYGFPSHNFVIDVESLKELGFPAQTPSDELCDMLDELGLVLMSLQGDIIELHDK